MSNAVVVGMQWGDEGKGKIVDLLCPRFDAVARYQGGHNAGHTVKFADQHFSLHLIPSGILRQGMDCVLGNGMVISPEAFFEELEGLQRLGIETDGRLFVSDRAQVILPGHVELDTARERAAGNDKIGSTLRGIGPAYEMKAARYGVRIGDLTSAQLEGRLRSQISRLEAELSVLGGATLALPNRVADQCREWAERLAPYVRDTGELLHRWMRDGRNILFEGAQGALLDLDHGTYPYVTSSSTLAGGACTGAGVPPTAIHHVLGVLKAYTTRVGSGPFTTEDHSDAGQFLRERGNEFGTTTGRPRRCGWMDLVAAKYSREINGVTVIALTKLDVLDTQAEIKVCTGYRYRGEILTRYPASLDILEEAVPEYRVLPGWQSDTVGCSDFDQLPQGARDYIAYLEEELETPIGVLSTGPRREETVVRQLGF
jgi:adenylosuccinate synthase